MTCGQTIGCLKISPDAKLNFEQAAKLWLETNQHAASSGTIKRRKCISRVSPIFKNLPVRNITEQNCDRWVKERGMILASETFVHRVDVLNAVFDFALNRGLILSNPAKAHQTPENHIQTDCGSQPRSV